MRKLAEEDTLILTGSLAALITANYFAGKLYVRPVDPLKFGDIAAQVIGHCRDACNDISAYLGQGREEYISRLRKAQYEIKDALRPLAMLGSFQISDSPSGVEAYFPHIAKSLTLMVEK